ncbi:DNRLRE domain-containing protein [Luteolibacter ambystomatis]|uniref:DNRLRE domain-containing protein n=1 Tax=Luteolibacter ambystomatis TaxID=2824561 RepID=A0A975G587_9BACT|nr:DNRLRE domain-containing protein [Luteolibacter ambystomatis]QUE49329.1 DNRLRE domain-containing protein [Luteolibacter ambystomatis]
MLLPRPSRSAQALLLCLSLATARAAPPQGTWVNLAADGRLLYARDSLGNRVPDFGDCGYKAGREAIPEAAVKVTLNPADGDDRARIQTAIDQVAAMPMDANGIRGAVLLTAGEYQLSSTLKLNASGVVLRGVGASDTGTRLRATDPRQYTLVQIGGSGSRTTVSSTTKNITDKYVPVGSRSFNVENTGNLAVGQSIVVFRPCTQEWINALGMDKLDNPWTPGDRDVLAERVITRIEGSRVFIDAPITTAIDATYGGGKIYRYTWSGRIQNAGIEDIKGISSYNATISNDENHAWTFIGISSAENSWVRRVVSQYFGFACVNVTAGGRQISILDSQSLDPISESTGGRRYAFCIDSATQCLVWNCYTKNDRHQYVTGSDTPGPHAFVSSTSDAARADVGPHHRWGSALLYDRVTCNGDEINVRNRGNSGTGHGWAGGNCVVWNSKADNYIIQNPPTARNWLIGSVGTVSGSAGTYDANGANVFPSTLWGNQRQDLQTRRGLQIREYVAGDFDQFTADAGETTPVDATWQSQVAAQGTTAGFDTLQAGRWVPWTHSFSLAAGESTVSATLWVSVRGTAANAQNGRLYIDDLANSKPLSTYAASIPTTGSTVLRIDLADDLARLADGKLNLAVQNNAAVDWSMLELRVAPATTGSSTVTLTPEADATIRAGASAAVNAGGDVVLGVKEATGADDDRRALLRWDLSGISSKVLHAKIRLVPVTVDSSDLENGAVVCTSNTWAENTVTWNNQPAAPARLVTWWPRQNQPVEFIVTTDVLAAMAKDKKLSVQLFSARESGGTSYASREDADPARRPQLVLVTDGTFSLDAQPPARSTSAGTSTTYTVSMTTRDGFTGSAAFSATGLPAGATATFAPPSLSAAGTTVLTLTTAASTPGGTYDITILANGTAGTARSQVSLTVTSPGTDLIWNSPSGGVWDLTTANWFNEITAAPDTFQAGKKVVFTDRANVITQITLPAGVTVAPAGITLSAEDTHFSLDGTGAITGTGPLVKSGGGTFTLSTTNDRTGTTTISGGALEMPVLTNGGVAGPLGAASTAAPNIVLDGGCLRWIGNTATTTNRGFTLTANGGTLESSPTAITSLTWSGTIATSGSGDRVFTLGGSDPDPFKGSTNTLAGIITDGPGGRTSVVKSGGNSWVLSGTNTWSGGTRIEAGRLRGNNPSGFGTGPVMVADGGQIYLASASSFANAFTIVGLGIPEIGGNYGALRLTANNCNVTGPVTLAGNARITGRLATTTGGIISGKISGEYSLELGGSATANDAGVTTRLTASANACVLRGSPDADQGETQTLATKRLNDSNTRISYLRFNLADILAAYTLPEIDSMALQLHLTAPSASDTLRVYALADTNATGVSDATWTAVMTWNNQPARTTAPDDIPNSSAALPNANAVLLGSVANYGGVAGIVSVPLDIVKIRDLLATDTNQQITLLFHNTSSNIASWAALGNTSGLPAPVLEIIGRPYGGAGGILTLSNPGNQWTGQTTISHGTVKLGSATALPHGADKGDVVINNNNPNENSVLDLKGTSPTLNALSSSGPVTTRCIVTNTAAATATLTLGDNDADGDFAGILQNGPGVLALTKTGTGIQILSGVNTFTGSTIIAAGTLMVNGTLATGPVQVQAGGVLSGTGTLGGSVTILPDGTISPGVTIGTLNASQSLQLQGRTEIDLDKTAGTRDEIRGATVLTYGGTLAIRNQSGALAAGDQFQIFTAAAYAGSFATLEPAFPAIGLMWDTSQLDTSGTLRVRAATPIETWRQNWFGTGADAGLAADLATPAGDGVSNLLKYATGTEPSQPAFTRLPRPVSISRKPGIRFQRNLLATDVGYEVHASGDLIQWLVVASRTAGASIWALNGAQVTDDGTGQVTITETASPGSQRFLRLKVTR